MILIDAISEPEKALSGSVAVLNNGGLAAIPTETVYGLAADATNGEAVAKIFAAKGRPQFNPLICHVSNLTMAEQYGEFSPLALKLVEEYWPGPLTIVVPLKPDCGIHKLVSAGLDTIALRCPQGIVGEVANQLGHPIAAPSANTSGTISPTIARHVVDDLGEKVDLVIDGGACNVGLESTIVKPDGDEVYLLRSGSITIEMLEGFLQKPILRVDAGSPIQAPGMMASHYAPRAGLRLNIDSVNNGEVLLAFGDNSIENADSALTMLNLSPTGDLVEAAANLYDFMIRLDATGVKTIAVQSIPETGLGEAINDRLNRAAAPKSGNI
jgi:L-threonylcarbamoyladenylate synthase